MIADQDSFSFLMIYKLHTLMCWWENKYFLKANFVAELYVVIYIINNEKTFNFSCNHYEHIFIYMGFNRVTIEF